MRYGYARVSSLRQERKFGLDVQEKELKNVGAEIIIKEAYTGTTMERKEFTRLLNEINSGDELIVCKLDRIARTALEGAKTVRDLVDKGVRVNILNMGIADNTPMGKLMVTVMFAFAEFERDMIVERTSAGKEIAKQNPDYKEGHTSKKPKNFLKYKKAVLDGSMTIIEAIGEMGISRRSYYNYVKE